MQEPQASQDASPGLQGGDPDAAGDPEAVSVVLSTKDPMSYAQCVGVGISVGAGSRVLHAVAARLRRLLGGANACIRDQRREP